MIGHIITPRVYKLMSHAVSLMVPLILFLRTKKGKEDFLRKNERIGKTKIKRPDGLLIWIHAASIGEALGALPLIKLIGETKNLNVLVTTGTVTSASILTKRLPELAIHQYVPLDYTSAIQRFLNHWQPNIALWMESEFWPNLILQTAQRDIPMILVNARISDRSAARWARTPLLSKPLLKSFKLILAQTNEDKQKFASLGAREIKLTGNIKFDSDQLPVNIYELEKLNSSLKNRPFWLAASTHPGEEEIVAMAHKNIKHKHGSLLTILCPRHPHRGQELATYLRKFGLIVKQRSLQEPITDKTDIYLADTLGEMGLFYRISKITFIGGSLVPMHGHNPVEAAMLGSALISGPDMKNFAEADDILTKFQAMLKVANHHELSAAVNRWLEDEKCRAAAEAAASQCISQLTGALNKTLSEIEPILNQLVEKNEE